MAAEARAEAEALAAATADLAEVDPAALAGRIITRPIITTAPFFTAAGIRADASITVAAVAWEA